MPDNGSKPLIGISSCLLGNNVRYDGGHKLDNWLKDTLGAYVDYVIACPEAESGLGIPREAMRLVGSKDLYLVQTQKTAIDHTPRLTQFSLAKVEELLEHKLCGFVLKSKSPSCGMERVKIYPSAGGVAAKNGQGVFAKVLMQACPLLPIEEEGRLHDPDLRENFIERIFTMQRWQKLLADKISTGKLIDFHSRHKLLLMAHSVAHYRTMGKLVATATKDNLPLVLRDYHEHLMTAMAKAATPSKHQNVLLHILGYFKQDLDSQEKAEAIELINQYKQGLLPLIVPITLFNHFVRKYDKSYLAIQYYLAPHPLELKLRNHC